MPEAIPVMEAPSAPSSFDLESTIRSLVKTTGGVKDTDLTRLVLSRVGLTEQAVPEIVTISQAIHALILKGKLIGVDCETPEGSFTLVLPPLSSIKVAMPIEIKRVLH